MKVSVDMTLLQTTVATAPAQAVAVSEQTRRTARRTEGTLRERLNAAALKALDDIEEELERDETSGNSKVTEKTRHRLNMFLLQMEPSLNKEHHQAPTMRIELAVGSVESASKSALFGRQQKTIEGEVVPNAGS